MPARLGRQAGLEQQRRAGLDSSITGALRQRGAPIQEGTKSTYAASGILIGSSRFERLQCATFRSSAPVALKVRSRCKADPESSTSNDILEPTAEPSAVRSKVELVIDSDRRLVAEFHRLIDVFTACECRHACSSQVIVIAQKTYVAA